MFYTVKLNLFNHFNEVQTKMNTMATPATTEELANISQYLWTSKIAKDNAFFNGNNNLNDGRDLVLMVQNAALSYGVANNLDGLEGVALNVYRLCGAVLTQAQEILSTGSGGVVPSPSGTGGLIPFPITVIISAGQAGVNTLQDDDWIGLQDINLAFINQGTFQLDINDTMAQGTFAFNSVSGTFTFYNYILQENDLFTSSGYMPTS